MERCQWITALAAAMLFMIGREVLAQDAADATVRVAIHDSAEVPHDVLEAARSFAASVFTKAGVGVDWAPVNAAAGCRPDGQSRFCIQVLVRPRNQRSTPGLRRVMGVALAADERRAVLSIYFGAVTDVARRYGSSSGHVLGLALAHEMGHVLLPPPSHSSTGIMQAAWEGDDIRHALAGDAAFTDVQAHAMRARLGRRH